MSNQDVMGIFQAECVTVFLNFISCIERKKKEGKTITQKDIEKYDTYVGLLTELGLISKKQEG
jgi:hypothetical protein